MADFVRSGPKKLFPKWCLSWCCAPCQLLYMMIWKRYVGISNCKRYFFDTDIHESFASWNESIFFSIRVLSVSSVVALFLTESPLTKMAKAVTLVG